MLSKHHPISTESDDGEQQFIVYSTEDKFPDQPNPPGTLAFNDMDHPPDA